MERDFMGLGNWNHLTTKEEVSGGAVDSAVTMRNNSGGGGGGAQWSFSNKVSAVPQFLSFQTSPEEKPRKSIYEPVVASSSKNYMSISNAEAFDSSSRRGCPIVQKNWFNDREAGSHRAMGARPVKHIDAFPVGSNKDIRMFPFSNQQSQPAVVPVSLTAPILHSHFASPSNGFRNSIAFHQQQKPLGGVPIAAPVSVIPATTSSVIGTTELRNSNKFSGNPAQLTIFYAGSVCVFDDISPEEAQAVMSMARRRSSPPGHNKTAPAAAMKMQLEIRSPVLPVDHHIVGNRSSKTPAGSSPPSAISVSSSTSSESGTTRSRAGSSSVHIEACSSKHVSSSGAAPASASASTRAPSGLPQAHIPLARKASLARFLEKRKERVTSSSPYAMGKKPAEGNVCA